MRKICPCYKCNNSGQHHDRCNEYKAWDIKDKEEKYLIDKARNRYKDADEFTSSIINKQRRKARL